MRRYFIIILFLGVLISQNDRSTLFSTGNPPELGVGWNIQCTNFPDSEISGDINQDGSLDVIDIVSAVGFIIDTTEPTDEQLVYADTNTDGNLDVLDIVLMVSIILNGNSESNTCQAGLSAAVRFSSSNDYTFEAFSVFFQTEELEGGGVFEINLHQDNNNYPGNILGSWQLEVNENIAREYNIFTGGTDCIVLSSMSTYWLSVHPINNQDEAIWLFSEDNYTYSTSDDMGGTWSSPLYNQVGCTKIFAEQIYNSPPPNPGLETVYDWRLSDINENSEYYEESIGPTTFTEQDFVSVYYFGKAG